MLHLKLGSKAAPAVPVYYMIGAASTLASTIMFTIYTVYFVERAHLHPLQLVLVGTVLESSVLIFEVPTGVMADTYSRRLSVIIGTFILGISFLVIGVVPVAAVILSMQVLEGLGYTFLSGALDAWLADEAGEENVGKIYLRSGQINRFFSLAGAVISVALASVTLHLPMVLGGAIFVLLGILLVIIMPETGFTPAPKEEQGPHPLQNMRRTLTDGIRTARFHPVLNLLLGVSLLYGAASEGYDRLYQAHLLENFTFPSLSNWQPIVWFGILNVAASLFTLVVVEIFRRQMEAASRSPVLSARILLALNLGSIACITTFALTGNVWSAMLMMLMRAAVGGLVDPLYNAWLVQSVNSRVRATVLSIASQGNALGQIVVGPAVGAIGSLVSLRAAIATAGLLLSPVSLLFARAIRSGRLDRQAELEATAEA